MSKFISSLDFVSVKPKIMFYSEPRHKTVLGGLFSIITFLAVFGFSAYLSYICVKREEMLLIYNEEDSGIPEKDLFGHPFIFAAVDNNGLYFPDPERYISILPSYRDLDPFAEGEIVSEKKLKFDYDCKKNIPLYWPAYKDDPNFGEKLSYKRAMCIDPRQPEIRNATIKGKYGDLTDGFKYLNVYFNKCVNDTKKGIDYCHPQEKIDVVLQNLVLLFSIVDYKVDNYNLTSVKKMNIRSEIIPLSPNLYRRININFRAIEYTTDFGYLFEESVTESFNKQEGYTENVDIRTDPRIPGNFGYIAFSNSRIKQKHKRSFMKLQNLFANIGGGVKGILLIVIIAENYISDALYYLKLSNDLILFEDVDKVYSGEKGFPRKQLGGSHFKMNNLYNDGNASPGKQNTMKMKNNYVENAADSRTVIKKSPMTNFTKKTDGMPIDDPLSPVKGLNDNAGANKKGPNEKDAVLGGGNANVKRASTNLEINYPRFGFSLKEYLALFCMRGKKYGVFNVVKKYIDRKTSIDHIIKKLHEVDINRFIMLEPDHLKWTKMIPGPDINSLYNQNMTSKLQELWAENEFGHNVTASEKVRIQKSLIMKDKHDDFEIKILELIDKPSGYNKN